MGARIPEHTGSGAQLGKDFDNFLRNRGLLDDAEAVERLLDPRNPSVALQTLAQVARGRRLEY